MKYKNILVLIISSLSLLFLSCGEGLVEVGPQTYEPKIVLQGYLQPGKKVEKILVTRNIPLNTQLTSSPVLAGATVTITDLQENKNYQLIFNPAKLSFEYPGEDLVIDYGKSYRILINAAIDGTDLTASSITKVPEKGFSILSSESTLGTMKYREKDSGGNIKNFRVAFNPSLGTEYYPISIVAVDASLESFVYDNPYMKVEAEDLKDEIDSYKYQMLWMQNVNSASGKKEFKIDWLNMWFYGNYRLIVYAGDENFRLYSQTHGSVMEFDGNFHEPEMNIEGEGIGVFGSFIADTVFVKVN